MKKILLLATAIFLSLNLSAQRILTNLNTVSPENVNLLASIGDEIIKEDPQATKSAQSYDICLSYGEVRTYKCSREKWDNCIVYTKNASGNIKIYLYNDSNKLIDESNSVSNPAIIWKCDRSQTYKVEIENTRANKECFSVFFETRKP